MTTSAGRGRRPPPVRLAHYLSRGRLEGRRSICPRCSGSALTPCTSRSTNWEEPTRLRAVANRLGTGLSGGHNCGDRRLPRSPPDAELPHRLREGRASWSRSAWRRWTAAALLLEARSIAQLRAQTYREPPDHRGRRLLHDDTAQRLAEIQDDDRIHVRKPAGTGPVSCAQGLTDGASPGRRR